MAAFPLKGPVQCASVCPLWANSGLMHRSKKGLLFDHVVCTCEQRRRYGETKCFGSFKIDQFEPSRRLHRQIGWLLAFQDAVDVSGPCILAENIRAAQRKRDRPG